MSTKNLLEDLIATERAMERALVRMLTAAGAFGAKGDKNAAEAVAREYHTVDKLRAAVGQSKGRLQALFEHSRTLRSVTRGTKRKIDTPQHLPEWEVTARCTCEIAWTGMNARCKACHPK